jgi:hypothetical protein
MLVTWTGIFLFQTSPARSRRTSSSSQKTTGSQVRNCNLRLSHKDYSSRPGMQPSSVRQICRSRNPFTPSIVLRQYFVLATPSVRSHQRFSSSTSQTIDSNKTASFENDSSPVSAGEAGKDGVPSPKATKLRNSKSHDAYNKPRTSRTPAGPQWKRHLAPLPSPSAPGPEQKDIMMKAQGAVEGLEDYTGVVVEPATFAQSRLGSRIERTDDAKLPWSLHRDELSLSGHERYLRKTR